MSSTPNPDIVKKLDPFDSPPAVLKGFVVLGADKYSTSVFYISGKGGPETFGPFRGMYVDINGGIEWTTFDKSKELPQGIASWILPVGLYEILLVPSKEAMFEPRQEFYVAVDEKGGLNRLTFEEVENLLNSDIPLPVPEGLFPPQPLDKPAN
jgi:hypothetical protein